MTNDSTTTASSTSPRSTDGATIVPPWACPPWCAQPPRHGFAEDGISTDSSRFHELNLATVNIQDAGSYAEPCPLTVTICQEEVIVHAGAGGIVLEPAFITYGEEHLTAAEARELGAALVLGADRLDQIVADAGR